MIVSALFVQPDGHYFGLSDVDPWDEERDARDYRGSHPVVAHPPCGRWCKFAHSVAARYPNRFPVGVDGGCFASALQSLRHWGGVLEHPAQSMAWAEYGLQRPEFGAWQRAAEREWVTEVWQVDYGHRAQKKTWLLYHGETEPFALRWERRAHSMVVGFSTKRCSRPHNERLGGKESSRTPVEFRDELIRIARHSRERAPEVETPQCSTASIKDQLSLW